MIQKHTKKNSKTQKGFGTKSVAYVRLKYTGNIICVSELIDISGGIVISIAR